MLPRQLLGALLALVALATVACRGGSDTTRFGALQLPGSNEGGVYLALGDSIAAGSGASDGAATSYVALVAQALRQHYGDTLELVSLARGGEATQDLIDQQLPAATERLRQGDVRVVTVTISGNDLNQVQYSPDAAVCIGDPRNAACPVGDILVGVEQRLDRILRELHAAGPAATIVIQVYPNLFSGTGNPLEHAADIAFDMLDDVIASVAGRNGVLVADPRGDFAGRGGTLTHLLDPTPDPHPNDAGYRLIAEAFLKALGSSTADGGTD